jgi:hypothetical protein
MRNLDNYKSKLCSLFIIAILICSGLSIIIHSNRMIISSKAISVWKQSSESEFIKGKYDNITIVGKGENAELRIDLLNLPHWTNKTSDTRPEKMCLQAMAPIYETDKVLLFGGYRSGDFSWDHTYIYDVSNNTWTLKIPKNRPLSRYGQAMASIYNDDKVVMFGGMCLSNGPNFNDTWVYDLSENNWTDITPINNPRRRQHHAMVSVYGSDKLVLFGGTDDRCINYHYNDTWVFDFQNTSWTQKTPNGNPGNRSAHSMASIHGTDKILLFGGRYNESYTDEFGPYDDTWIYDFSNDTWIDMKPLTHPTGRYFSSMASIYGTDNVMLFGGTNQTWPWPIPEAHENPYAIRTFFNDTWIYDLSENNWTQLTLTTKPTARCLHGMASVYKTDKVVLFGGKDQDQQFGPLLSDTWIYDHFLSKMDGTYTSKPHDTATNSSYKTISFNAVTPKNTIIQFQIRTGVNESDLTNNSFIGPDGTNLTFYNQSLTNIWSGHNYDRWVQYKAYLSTIDVNITPILKDVTIIYNNLPETEQTSPINDSVLTTNKPTFTWNFTDLDSESQEAFQVLIDDDFDFQSIDYNCELNSTNHTWHFPEGTNYTVLLEGIWYWKIRTKDNDGDWGFFSSPWKITIDSQLPKSTITHPENNTFYNNLEIISGEASDPKDGLGLNKVEISIEQLKDNNYWGGLKWSPGEKWLLVTGTNEWLFNTSSVDFTSGSQYNIQSRAIDNANNMEIPSSGKFFTYDTENVTFSNVLPSTKYESPKERVKVGITISDNISGVDATTVEYLLSTDGGATWSSWMNVPWLEDGHLINVSLYFDFHNGTANRIKWRASDIAGNGPTESKVYQIKVNTSLQQFIPQVKLWGPPNGSIIPTTLVELSWFLVNKNLVGVEYDLFLDTINPPIARREANLTDTHFKIFDLIDGETYYWTVIPKLEDEIGWCDSGVWSFSINTSVPFPKVQLISPENNSIITSPKPTLLWSLGYDGTEKVTYNVYLDTNENPIEFEKSANTYYLPERILEDNTTYYWKVIPMAGNVAGPSSATWRFTVKKGYVPTFGLKLELAPMTVGVKPGGITYAKAMVTNLGEITDSVSLNIEIPPNIDVGAIVNELITMDLEPGRIGIFNITVTATEDIEQNEVILTVVATSEKAKELGKTVEARETLTVKILRTEAPGKDKSSTEDNLWIFLLIAIIIIIVVIILFIVLKRKKRSKEELPTSETVTIKPMPPSDLEKPQEQLSPTPTVAQPLTLSTPESEKKVITLGTVAPELPSLSTESHEATPQQIPQVEPAPQLPPAQPQIATPESKDETSMPTQATSTETSENSTKSDEINEDPS